LQGFENLMVSCCLAPVSEQIVLYHFDPVNEFTTSLVPDCNGLMDSRRIESKAELYDLQGLSFGDVSRLFFVSSRPNAG